jgi:hypothetical protein
MTDMGQVFVAAGSSWAFGFLWEEINLPVMFGTKASVVFYSVMKCSLQRRLGFFAFSNVTSVIFSFLLVGEDADIDSPQVIMHKAFIFILPPSRERAKRTKSLYSGA